MSKDSRTFKVPHCVIDNDNIVAVYMFGMLLQTYIIIYNTRREPSWKQSGQCCVADDHNLYKIYLQVGALGMGTLWILGITIEQRKPQPGKCLSGPLTITDLRVSALIYSEQPQGFQDSLPAAM